MNYVSVVFAVAVSATAVAASAWQLGLGKPEPLYSPTDPIALLDGKTLRPTVLGSDKAWLVEFYSSWCGHCQHFAPTFKTLASEVKGWSSVISVAAVDCGEEVNMPICREYEIMAYPTLKLFPPKAHTDEQGTMIFAQKVVPIMEEMVKFVGNVEKNHSLAEATKRWPVMEPFKGTTLSQIWTTFSHVDPAFVLVVVDAAESKFAINVLLSTSEVLANLSTPVLALRVATEDLTPSMATELGLGHQPLYPELLAISRKSLRVERLTPPMSAPGSADTRTAADFVRATRDFVWRQTKELVAVQKQGRGPPVGGNSVALATKQSSLIVTDKQQIARRRYTVHAADLEKAVLYALSHEVSQHTVVTGDALVALQNFADVLVRFLPMPRKHTRQLLIELRSWILSHDDALRGEDLSKQIENLRHSTGAFSDLPSEFVACRGSSSRYGGYPCGLWMLWHSLTVSHATKSELAGDESEPHARVVLEAMVGYVKHFFGCQDCVRHFLQVADDGKAVERDVHTVDDAILWLWRAHNKANVRLMGDITDDPAFPKEKFPSKSRCAQCYDSAVAGNDLWTEFSKEAVLRFLKDMYSSSSLDTSGLFNDDHEDLPEKEQGKRHLRPVPKADSHVDKSNFSRASNTGSLLSGSDVGLWLVVYAASGVLLFVCYVRFISKRKSTCLAFLLPRKTRNPLVGKV